MRRSFAGTLSTLGGLCALALGLAAIDERVREGMARLFTLRSASGELATFGGRFRELAEIAFIAIRDQSIEQAPLVIFGLAALVLLLFMLRIRT
jgi:hypothetical protein